MSPGTALLFLVALSAFWGGALSQSCVLRFDINQAVSTFTISGQVTKPLPAPITGAAGQVVNASGPIFISLPALNTTCPPTNWFPVSLDGASLVAPPSSNPSGLLSVSPADIIAQVETLAKVTISDLTVNLTSLPLSVTPQTSNNQSVTVNQTWDISNALAAVAVLGGAPSLTDLGGKSTIVAGAGTFSVSNQTATLDFPRLAVSFTLTGSTAATITFSGRLLATSTLGCPSGCNINGQCLSGSCLCDCGFSGGSCASQISPPLEVASALVDPAGSSQVVLSGSSLGDDLLAAANNVSVPPFEVSVGGYNCTSLTRVGANNLSCLASSSPLSSQLSVIVSQGCQKTLRSTKTMVTLGSAPVVLAPAPAPVSGGLLDPSNCPHDLGTECVGYPQTATANGTCDCDCKLGWAGQSCNICQNDAACGLIGYSQCDITNLYGSNTTVKHYDCQITDPSLSNVVENGVSITVDVTAGTADVFFQAADNDVTPVNCTASQCSVITGTASWTCLKTHCDCGSAVVPCQAGSTVQALTAQISGAVKFTCTGQGGTDCTLVVDGFPVNIVGQCTGTECSNGASIEALVTKGADWTVIGSSLGSVAFVLGVAILVGRWARLRHRRKKEEEYLAWLAYKERRAANGEPVLGDSLPTTEAAFAEAAIAPGRSLVVEDLSVTKAGGKQKAGSPVIVSNVSLRLESGSMLAIMGPTGSGKTTLLNVLAGIGGGRTAGTQAQGQITVDGLARDSGYRYLAAYLPQEDFLYNTLTVLETVRYTALLRLPAYMPKKLKYEKVDEIIEYLGLSRVKDNRVGSSFGEPGLSGGERRRVRIAMELVSDPRIVLLDEPTSGLDAHTAARLVRLLHETARKGTIVVLSVHQPSQATFEEFDQVLLMSKRGRVIYFGPQKDIYAYFEKLGHPCAVGRNFADHMLQVVSEAKEFDDPNWTPPHDLTRAASRKHSEATRFADDIPSVEPVRSNGLQAPPAPSISRQPSSDPPPSSSIAIARQSSLTPLNIDSMLLKDMAPKRSMPKEALRKLSSSLSRRRGKDKQSIENRTLKDSLVGPDFHRSMITELGVLYWRELTNVVRNPALLALHLGVSMVMGLLVGSVFREVKEDIAGIQNRSGAFLFSVAFFSLASLSALEAFITERIIFTQEGSGMYYRTLSYYLPKITLDALFLRILPAVAYTIIMYWMMGLREDKAKFLLFLVVVCMVAMVAGEVCSCISLITASVGVANIIAVVVMLIMILFSGALVNLDHMASWIRWLTYLSFNRYSYEFLLTSQVEGLTVQFQPTNFPKPVPVKGEVFLTTLGLHASRKTVDIWVLFAMVGFYLIVAWLLLMMRVSQASRLEVYPDKEQEPPSIPEEAPVTESANDV